ncbi:uncharacterized protein LOC108993190 isoform X2 [Juglans regia]|uniref:Uncharacterized protein LOC108993190 isoform X2 n=1 Tax=Juglans regia TaxID=51240 RepID=A0A2I4EVX6_JUGRE|nr:uncharacterized protein LOC108993190 isoform X2 [Juglans regia]
MEIVTGDRYLEKLVEFVDEQAGPLLDGAMVLKLNPAGLHYVQSRLEALNELESLLAGAPIDYLRAYVSDLGDHRALEQLRRILRLIPSLKVVSALTPPSRDPTPLSLRPFGRLRVLELRGCDLSTSAARGLLELRHTLEKIICHNSTDALRHVFASRIAEIKGSPQWNRLSFVSCACNGLILMDESLQLLPAVETLDLSRNKFAKVDNLRKCAKLKHLDLGFNHLRSITYFNEVSCRIVKLVLRNNALATLHGIENLKSLEGLDVSYNVISNFSELEFLGCLPSLRSLWLEGNPLCCARWYRAQVFSFFNHLDKLKLDDKHISTREFWKRQIIIASRQKRPATFGFYSPAKDEAIEDGSICRRRKKASRLASIEKEEENTYICSDQESVSCDVDIQSREEAVMSDAEAEIVDLMNRVELMKKERSVLWLRELRVWMDHASENFVERTKSYGATLHNEKENYTKGKPSKWYLGDSSRYVSDSVQASGDDSSTNVLESDNSFADMSTGLPANPYFSQVSFLGNSSRFSLAGMGRIDLKEEHPKSYSHDGITTISLQAKSSHPDIFAVQGVHGVFENVIMSPLPATDDMLVSHSPSPFPASPPHYQEDILHRRHNLVEETLQLSAESYSPASSDSNTSCSDGDFRESIVAVDKPLNEAYARSAEGHSFSFDVEEDFDHLSPEIPHVRENGTSCSFVDQTSSMHKFSNSERFLQSHCNDFPAADTLDDQIACYVNQEADCFEKRKSQRKLKKKVIPLLGENNVVGGTESSFKSDGNLDICGVHGAAIENEQGKQISYASEFQEVIHMEEMWRKANVARPIDDSYKFPGSWCSSSWSADFIENFFNTNIAESSIHETCRQYLCCDCVLEPESKYGERCREVILVMSSEHKLYVLLIGISGDGSGAILSLVGCHKMEDIREVSVGVGLQVVRLCIDRDSAYLFITRSIEKSRQLFSTLKVFDLHPENDHCSLRSLEQVQVELLEKQICGGSKVNIFQYSMVLFRRTNNEEDIWLSRSLFVIGRHLLVCVEDLIHFSSLSMDSSLPPYFSLDSCCSIVDLSEMVIEARESRCVTLALKCTASEFYPSAKANTEGASINNEKKASGCVTWKIRWFSEESLFNFVALVKAIHAGTSMSPLLLRCKW